MKKEVIIEINQQEYKKLCRHCKKKKERKSTACRETVAQGTYRMEEELSYTGTIRLEIAHTMELTGKPVRVHVYLSDPEMERLERLSNFVGMRRGRLARYLLADLLH